MLGDFLKVAYENKQTSERNLSIDDLLLRLPVDTLQKLAAGEVKLSSMLMSDCKEGGETWLEKFEGSPLLEEAVALAHQELEAEMTELQKREERKQTEDFDAHWRQMDQIRLQKKMLELKLVEMNAGMLPPPSEGAPPGAPPGPPPEAAAPGVPAQGAGGMGDGDVNAPQLGKAASAFDRAGRMLASRDMSKLALDANTLMAAAKGVGTKAVDYATKHPGQIAGGALGAGAAMATGPEGQGIGGRLLRGAGGAVGGAALGHGVQHAAQNIHTGMQIGGTGLGETAQAYGSALKNRVSSAVQNLAAPHLPPGAG